MYIGQRIDGQQNTSATPLLVYIYTRAFKLTWNSDGSNAVSDVAIWQPQSDQGI